MSSTSNDVQHDRLRKRLEDELQAVNNLSDNIDYDWFLRGQFSSASTDESTPQNDQPTAAATASASATTATTTTGKPSDLQQDKSNNASSLPPLHKSTTPAPISPLLSPSMMHSPNNKAAPSISTSRDDTDLNMLSALTKSRTADARMLTSVSRTSTNSSFGTPLQKTATTVDATDIGVSRTVKKPAVPPSTKPVSHTPIPPPSQAKKKGFFKKLFGSKSDDPKPEINIYKSEQPKTSSPPSLKSATPSRKTSPPTSDASSIQKKQSISSNIGLITPSTMKKPRPTSTGSIDSDESTRTGSKKGPISEQYKEIDPQLSTYLKEIELSTDIVPQKPSILEHDYNYIYSPMGLESISYEPDVIPPHPDKPKLPSAFASKPKFGGSVEKELFLKQKKEREEKESSMFGSLLHRTRTNTVAQTTFVLPLNESEDTPPLNFNPIKYVPPPAKVPVKCPIESLNVHKPMKKVAFASTTFVNDPPQQIPSRNPRKGNVEICSNGELIIHKIDPQEKLNSATGIVVGGSGHLKLVNEDSEGKANDMNLNIDGLPSAASMKKTASAASVASAASQGSYDQTIKKEDKIAAAKKAREKQAGEEIDVQKEHLTIDKPMVKRKKSMAKPVVTLKMDELYTRCCHLREILPIPATLKQIPKGSTDPIPLLHLRNPRPSMIEILSFTDFIRIAPVICVSFDGVSMTNEMFRIVLSSLLYKKYLEKLSLRNTPIDQEGWEMLCIFLSMNKSLKRLDITQCPSLDVHTQRIKKKATKVQDTRMTCNLNDRSDRNWALFTASLIFRGGIDDLVLTGCKIPDLRLFSNLLNLALVRTGKIGLAYNSLSLQHCYVIARWLEANQNISGIDIGYNDMSSFLPPLTEYAKSLNNTENNLTMLSLNSCNLLDSKETEDFFDAISKLPKLRYLDLSSNAKLMKSFLIKLATYLPWFHNLMVLYLDNNNLDSASMVRLLEAASLAPNLARLSIVGNDMNEVVAESLCKALQNNVSLYSIEFDKDAISPEYQKRIGLMTMKNVEKQLYIRTSEIDGTTKSFADIISLVDKEELRSELGLADGMSFSETFYKLLHSKKKFDKHQYEKFLTVIVGVRANLKNTIQELTKLHSENKLSVQGKEMLLRLLSMDASIDKAFELINDDQLNSIKDTGKGDTAMIKGMYNKAFERDNATSGTDASCAKLDLLIKNMKNNPFDNTVLLKKIILGAKDPYDLISMLKHCKERNITIQDLFLKNCNSKQEDPDIAIKKLPEHALDDDASIDSHDLEDATDIDEYDDEKAVENSKLQSIYDQILKDFKKHKP